MVMERRGLFTVEVEKGWDLRAMGLSWRASNKTGPGGRDRCAL